MRLKLLQKLNTEKLNLESLQANGLNGRIQGPKRVNEQLNEYIYNVFKEYEDKNEFVSTNKELLNSSNTLDNIQDTNDVISIPASQTIDLIYKYRVHAHPNNYIRYPYKSVNYYTFREKDGWMKKLYALENTISFNPQNTEKLYKSEMDSKIKQRILAYIDGRNKSMGFEDEEIYSQLDNEELKEGERIKRVIEIKKRNSKARQIKLEAFKLKNGKVYCEVCGEEDICALDVHHDNVQVSNMEDGHITKIADLRVVVCVTCHRKIHGHNITVEELRNKSY